MSFALKQENELPFLSLVEGPMLKVLPGGKAETKPLAEVIPTPSLGGRIIPFHTESRQPLAFRSHEKAINLLSIDSKFIAFSVQGTNPTSCNFDKANRLTRISLEPRASSLKLNCVYDKVSNVTQKKTANGVTLSYVYDALNRLTTKTTPEQTYAFTYDSLSRLIGASNTASNLSFVYDAVSQLLEADTAEVIASGAKQSQLVYGYDAVGRRTTLTDSTGSTTYGYDKANRLTQLAYTPLTIRGDGGVTFNFTYDLGGRRTGLTGPNGLSKSYTYDNANRLLSLINKINDTEIAPFQYEYDKAGNRTQKTDKHGTDQYGYDSLYRLLSSSLSSEAFNYDLTGNRTSDQTQSYTANELNQLTSGTSGLSLSYDANGNVTSKTENGITWTYTWNSENQLTKVTNNAPTPVNVSFQYDALGRRLSKTSNGNTSQFIYDGNDILLEYQNGILTNRYTHGSSVDEPLARTDLTTGANYFYHADALGSITAITDSSGAIVENYRYSSYGVPTIFNKDGLEIGASSIGNFYLHTGSQYDPETKNYHHFYRERDASLGVWISKDPIGFNGGINVYEYTGSNPINWTDPLGLDKTEWPLFDNGRTVADGPRNGNWGGGKWSGGKGGGKIGTAPYTDSGDLLYMQHDFGWARCEKKYGCDSAELKECKKQYNKELVDKAKKLPDDPRKWPEPPRPGTESDSKKFKDDAIWWFS